MSPPLRHYEPVRMLQAMRLLTEWPYSAPELAEVMQVAPMTARGLLQRLALEGIVERQPYMHHARYRLADGAFRLGLALVTGAVDVAITTDRRPRPTSLGQCLLFYRRTRRLSCEVFADMLGLDRVVLGEIERGTRDLAFTELAPLAARLGVDPLNLLLIGDSDTGTA